MKRLSAIILAIALAVSVMAEPLSAVWMLTGNLRSGIAPIALTDSADTMTVVVTHWHASEESGRPVGESDDSSREKAAETLVAQFKNNDGTYTLNGLNDEGESGNPDSCMKYDGEDTANVSSFFVSPKAYHADGDETEVYEKFAGFSVTTGNDATKLEENSPETTDDDKLKVTYNDNIRLVKIDVLYEYAEPIVAGTPDSTVFADSGSTKKNAEKDTSFVYGYPLDTAKAKEPIKNGSTFYAYGDTTAKEQAKAAVEAEFADSTEDLTKVKVYSVEEGLHTDKTATITENSEFKDGRTFDLQLEAWYSGDNKAKVGLVLDSSGSMAFTSAEPNSAEFNKIKVDEGEIGSLGITKVPAPETKEDAFNGDDWFIKDTDLDKILDTRKTDNSPNGYNGYSYYIYDSRSDTKEFAPIGYWDGEDPKTEDYSSANIKKLLNTKIPQFSNILGYYSFEKNGYKAPATDPAGAPKVRDWAFNQVTGNNAYIVDIKDLSSDFEFTKGGEYKILDDTHNFNDTYGYNASYEDKGGTMQGLLLDVAPSSNSFTLSFKTIKHDAKKGATSETDNDPKANQLIYIGPLSKKGETPYYNVIRAANTESNIAKMLYQNIDTNCLSSCENIYKDEDTPHFITYVFTDTTVTTYVDGTSKGSVDISDKLLGDGNRNIILNGFVDNYDGMSIFIDDLFVFDCALSTDEVSSLYKNYQSLEAKEEKNKKYPMTSDSTSEEHYFEVDGNPVGQVPDEIAELSNADDRKGWYYVSSASDYYTNLQTMGTAKDFRGLKVKDSDDNLTKYNYAPDENKFGASSRDAKSQTNYYTYTITSKKESPLKFFVDSKGYLCCFYNTGGTKESEDDRYGWSYVYKKVDTSQTKVEVLQRALGLFATGLQETSPTSSIAATKFSTDRISEKDYNQLVLLDWTKSPDEAADVLSQSRGKDAVLYQMTGSTCTYTGLQSFIDNLAKKNDDDVNKKYLIIFTDGKDTELSDIVTSWKYSHPDKNVTDDVLEKLIKKTRAYKLAKEIRDTYNYDIYAIMLSGGTVDAGDEDKGIPASEDYLQAVKFLAMLTEDEAEADISDDNRRPIRPGKNNTNVYDKVYEGSDAGSLITIFSKNIVDIISDDLSEYSVKDYLDPRFDLVDADNNVWKLNDEGVVNYKDTNYEPPYYNGLEKPDKPKDGVGEESKSGEEPKSYVIAKIKLSNDRESDGQDAVLNYDAGKHLYFLTWKDVTVPGCNSETVSLPVWNATVTVHAKEDFIGGNYVLTNGNMQLENYVSKNNSTEANSSSGTDKAKRDEATNPDPSKGFPRTTVNVQIPDITIEGDAQVIYMGEELTPYGVAEKLGETIYDNWEVSKDRSQWYWEYLKRYPKLAETMKNNADFKDVVYNSFDDIVDEIVGHESTSFNYYYLPPSSEATNVDGETGVKHETDKLGVLKFDWTKVKTGYNSYPDDNITKDTLDRASALTVTYTPSTTIDRQNSNDDGQLQSENNGSPVYQWDDDFKPAQGSVKESVSATGTYVTKIVSGQTAFDLKIPADVAEYLSKHYSGYTLTYTATLKREYQARSESDGTYETKTDSVGTYEAQFDIPSSENTVEGKITYEKNYDYAENYGLPLGVYSFINPTLTVTKGAQTVENIGVKCGDITVEQVTNSIQSKFSRYTEGEKTADELLNEAKSGIAKTAATGIEKFAAKTDTSAKKIYIGQKDNYNEGTSYLDNRYGYGYGTLALDTGSLSITKTVVGLATGEANPDTYTITLSGDGLSGNYKFTSTKTDNTKDSITFTNGTSEEFEITADETVTIAELPAGVQIKIDEDVDGKVYTYTKDISPDSVVISTGGSTSTVTNTVKTGSLTISKEVKGPVSTEHEKDTFKFTVEAKVGETKLNGTYNTDNETVTTVKFTDGESDEITLKGGESITIQGLPVGTEFTVVETKDDNYTTTISDDSGDDNDGKGTITEGNSDVTVAFTNTFIKGRLSITKTVEKGFSSDNDTKFSFSVGFTNLPSGTEFKYKIGSEETTFTSSPIEIELKHGETAVFDGLPVGTEFTVEEIGTLDDYTVSATVDGTKVDDTSGKIIAKGKIEATTDNTPIAVAFVNTRKTGSVTIEKKLTAAEGTTLIDNDNNTPFTFTVNLYESDGKTPIYGTYTTSSGSVTFAEGEPCEITLKSGESITISGLPVDAKVTVSETAKDGFEEVGDQDTVVTEGTTAEDTAKLTFNNVKKAPKKTEPVTISAIKNLNDKPSDVQFSFSVKKPDGTTEPATNDTKGNIEILKGVTFDKVGSYVYTVSENDITGDDAKKYIKDNSVYQITVNVAEEYENGVYTGKLVATTEIKQTADSEGKKLDEPEPVEAIVFNNKAKTYSLTVNKEVVLNGRTDIPAETPYGFEVVFEDIDVSKLSLTIDETPQTRQSGNSITFSLKKDGKAVISNIPYGAHYEISESQSDDYSMSSEDDLSGNVDGDKTVTVKNTYSLKVAAINAIKTLDGGTLAAGQFKFEVTENGVTKTVFNDGDGKIELIPEKTYTEEESHVYTVREVVDESDTKIKYDKSVYEITVNVTKNAAGELEATTEIERAVNSEGKMLDEPEVVTEITFNNSVIKPATVTAINATKKLDGEKPEAGLFKFEIADENGAKTTVTNKADGSIELIPEKTYTEEESHVYTVKEVVDESDTKIKYDKSVYEITVNVTKNGDELVATTNIERTADSEGKTLDEPKVVTEITFNNAVIKPATVTAINATKTLSGATLTAGQFKFEIADENGAKTTVTNKADGSIELIPEKTFAEEESHVYTVKEVADENNPKIKYDKSVYEITVNVKTNDDGELEATTNIERTMDSEGKTLDTPVPVTDITFENTSVKEEEQPPEPEIELGSITIRKIVGGSQGDKTLPFEFTLSFENLPIGFDTSTLEISGGRDVKQSGAVITFKLADSEELTVKDIPLGTTYLVVETPVDGYGTTAGGVTGNSSRGPISEQKKNVVVEFKNTNPIQEAPLLGGFTVKKTVISDDPDDLETPFEFSIQLDPMPAEPDVSTAYTVSGNVITVHLADGEIAKISSLPYGTSFIVNEAQTGGFESRLSETSVASGKISAEQNDFEIEYVNTRTAPPIVEKEEFGNLTIVKFVSGNGFAEGQQFNFTVQLGSDKLYAYTGTGIGPADGYIRNGDTITLTKNTYIKIHNIPYGTAYSVMEAEADANTVITDGYGIITDGSGIISETNRDAVAQFSNSRFIAPTVPSDPTNPDEPTKLMLTKYVRHTDGTDPDPLAAFTFTVAFASPDPLVPFDFSLNCTVEGQLTSWIDPNTLSVTLHHNESVMVSGMPVGTTYVITEAPVEGYSSKFITGNETGILGTAGQSVSVVAENTKSTPVFPAPDSSPTGSLTITKEVKSGDKSKPFTFIAEFTPMTPVDLSTVCTLGGNYTSAEWNGNILTVQLTDGQAILIDVIPYGTSYNVYESGSEGYRVTPSEEVRTVSSETPNNVASFSNSRLVGSLSVSKTVSLGSKTKPFTFSIVFTPTEQISLRGICRISGSYTSAVWNENVLTLKLTDGQNAIINGIPSNTAYSIVESDNEGYEVSSVNSEGTIIADTQIKASFTNTLKCGSLTVKKIVGLGNKQQPFTFTVSFTPNSSGIVLSSFTVISGDYTSAVWNGDILTLMLADGQSASISNIPYGTAYSVVEAPVPLYTSTPDEYASGVISAETPEISTVVVNVQNYNPPSGPIPDNPVQPPVVDDGPDTDDIVVIPATESGEGEGDEVAEDNEASEESNPKTGLTLGLGAISAALTALVISKRR